LKWKSFLKGFAGVTAKANHFKKIETESAAEGNAQNKKE